MNSDKNAPAQASKMWERTLFILAFNQLASAAGFSSIFPFLPLYVEELGSSSGMSIELLSGLVFSGQAFAMMLASPIWGNLADRFGRKLMIQRATFSGAVLLLMMAFVRSAEELVLLRTIQGLVTGVIAANNALVASITPRKRSGYAMGVLQMAFGVGIAIGPMMGGAIADAFSYRTAFYVTSALLLVAGLVVTFGVKEPVRPNKEDALKSASFMKEWKFIFATNGVTVTFVLRFLTQLGRMMVIAILAFFARELIQNEGQLNSTVGLMIGASAGAATLTAIYLGKLGDRIGHQKVLIGSTLFSALVYLPQAFVTTAWQLVLLQGLAGVALGGIIPSMAALLANYVDSGHEGAVYGLDNSINAAGRSAAPLIGGLIAGWLGLRVTFISTGAVFLLTTIIAFIWLPGSTPEPDLTTESAA
ncbi:MAG TPA: MFS transporter [Anaerolineales bacterium]|nr:MFS transporter [Anaerolineales bacterium]